MILEVKDLGKQYYSKVSGKVIALEGINFSLNKGDVLGIIGPNGSGKSTLLKIIAGVTRPSSGFLSYDGKLVSILDIGAGFHPDLTGLQNIFLVGEIQGVSRLRINQVLDELIDFSGLDEFINMPVKNYSKGMFLRLAFSTLLFFDFDILLLDEVASVGDAEFRRKSQARISKMFDEGKTILLVSHDPLEIYRLCSHVALLDAGKMTHFGSDFEILENYEGSYINSQQVTNPGFPSIVNDDFSLLEVNIFSNESGPNLLVEEDIIVEMIFEKKTSHGTLDLAFSISNVFDIVLMSCSSHRGDKFFESEEKGIYTSRCKISKNLFSTGTYVLNIIALKDRKEVLGTWEGVRSFDLKTKNTFPHTDEKLVRTPGFFSPSFEWDLKFNS